ncbi:MDIS1-interacting receptor like kinase 2-like [Senna tora]|uniref:non-specific serine/threonine protein kinase n=1 Tax=Senna tora TaxID=362788 RepID=A0A834W9U3_9FABA|nr:MDIS1-interacting receptor like kinase 2-like [Senna tora]
MVIAAQEDESEAKALLEWKASLSPKSQPILSSWQNGTNPCKHYWKGITCDESTNMLVSFINLTTLGLQGTLHTLTFSSFPNLHFLDLSYNMFYGNIPPQIGNLSSISTLNLGYNIFQGTIPKEIGSLTSLNRLDLGFCNLTSPIPPEIGKLKNLTDLILGTNKLFGSIPQEIGMLSNLHQLDLSENSRLVGRIPSSIGNLTKLYQLYLYNCSLSGPIPNELGRLFSLIDLQLLGNSLYGPVPSFLGNLTNLTVLRLTWNNLNGPIPPSIGNLVNLEVLHLGYNSLSGNVPSTIGNMTKLSSLQLFFNKLSGHLPLEMNKITNLINLQIGDNDFDGPLPQQICLGGSLQKFVAKANRFVGQVPSSLKNCYSLTRLRLDDNQLVQNITEAFSVYPRLNYIDVSGNQFYGHLSSNWGNCPDLTSLRIANNNLSGGIPPNLGDASNLGELNLSSNNLLGEIPKELGKLTSLTKLSLSHNNLSGNIPSSVGSLHQLEQLELQGNNLSGSITKDIGGLNKLWLLNLRGNKFEDRIPFELGELQSLQSLDLSGNLLEGAIPSTLGGLKMLETLNLSHNNLSGAIPPGFDEMSSLYSVDMSYNQLEGSLPNNPAFHKFQALKNNKGLCGNVSGLHLCTNSKNNSQHDRKIRKVKLLILFLVLGTLIITLLAIGLVCIFCGCARKTKEQDKEVEAQEDDDLYFAWSSERELLLENIIEATNNFDDNYLIGKGGQGSVYKAELPKGKVFAVKKFHSRPDGEISNKKAFTTEVQALTEIKHRNIVKLHGFYSSSQLSFLVYEFMEGGSLDNILKNEKQATELDWSKRVNVVRGVANALSHMHHGCTRAVVHRDISSKNVLLDSEYEEAHITDFATTKFLKDDASNMTSFAGTVGYAAPEIAYMMEVNVKCDVYSFGVLALEIIMGKHPGDFISSLAESSITYDFLFKDLLDSRLPLPTTSNVEELMLIAKLAFACLNENPNFRPTMEEVSTKLVKPNYNCLGDKFPTITIGQLMKIELSS